MAVAGVVLKVFMVGRLRVIAPLLYLGMGWMIIIAINPLLSVLPIGGVVWLVAGGCTYSVGLIFYACDKIPYNHTIWHLFVLGGSLCHYLAVLFYVLPLPNGGL
jgi:hemolysin III